MGAGSREGLSAPENRGKAVGSSALDGPTADSVNIELLAPIRKTNEIPASRRSIRACCPHRRRRRQRSCPYVLNTPVQFVA